MSNPALHNLIRKRRESASAVAALVGAFGTGLAVEGPDGELLLGERGGGAGPRCPVTHDGEHLGWVSGNDHAAAVASLLGHLAAREAERKTLASEVLHLYREVNLIYSFSEKLASTLDLDTVAALTLDQARHLITATDGAVMLLDEATGRPQPVATFGEVYSSAGGGAWADGVFAAILASGQGEIVNDAEADPRHVRNGHAIASLICTPLKVGERVTGLIALSNSTPVTYAAADLKLVNTLALQTASALENARLFERTVQAALDRERLAALHKELEVASQIQRAIVPSRFPPFPDRTEFAVHASMTPAKAVGGDFFDFFLIDADRLGVVIADVSGKGVPSALFMAVCRTLIKSTAHAGGVAGRLPRSGEPRAGVGRRRQHVRHRVLRGAGHAGRQPHLLQRGAQPALRAAGGRVGRAARAGWRDGGRLVRTRLVRVRIHPARPRRRAVHVYGRRDRGH